MHGPFSEELLETMQCSGFPVAISRALKLREMPTGLLQRLDTQEKAALFSKCAKGVGSAFMDMSPEKGVPNDEWNDATRRRLRLRSAFRRKECACVE